MATVSAQIQEIYIGLLGRAADKAGLDYWTNQVNTGVLTTDQVRENIVTAQSEYAAGLGSMTRAQLVAELYNRMFERAPEAEGLEYWVNGGGASVPANHLVTALSKGASASDTLVLNNKTAAADYYTATVTTYDAVAAKSVVDSVDGTSASVAAAKAAVDSGSTNTSTGGQTFNLTASTDSGTDFVGTANADTYVANLSQNPFVGGVSNTLSSADRLDGQAGTDTLTAELVPEFFGITGNNQIDVQPTTTRIENVEFQARDSANSDLNTSSDTITVDAKNMTDIEKIGSKFSDGDLVIENLTTLTAAGAIRDTETITITMDHTDNFNSDEDASDLTVYFDEDYLIPVTNPGNSSVVFKIMNQDSYDRNGGELRLDGVYVARMQFSVNGTSYDLAPFIEENAAGLGNEFQTEAALVAYLNATALPALIAANPSAATALSALSFSIGNKWNDNNVNRFGDEIVLTASNAYTLETRDAWLTIDQAEGVADSYASNRIERTGVYTGTDSTELSVNVELHKVGREGEGGNLIVGGKELDSNTPATVEGKGIQTFNISVLGDASKLSNLGTVASTNEALTTVNIVTHADYAAGSSFAKLTIRDGFDADTETVTASGFKGDLTLGSDTAVQNLDTLNATGGGVVKFNANLNGLEKGVFTYTTGSAGDTVTVALDGDAVDMIGTSFTTSTGAGNDTVTITMDSVGLATAPDVSFQTMAQLNNLVINTDSGDDTVDLNAYGTFQINAGDGSDFVIINSTGQNGDASKGTWTFGQETGAQTFGSRVLYNATLQVTFAGFEQTVSISTDATGNYIANQLTINEAIKSAIAANPELARLLAVENSAVSAIAANSELAVENSAYTEVDVKDTSSTGTQELVVSSTVGGLNDLRVVINQPLLTTNDLVAADVTALRQGIINTTAITSTDLGDTAAIVAQMGNSSFGNGALGAFSGNVGANGVVGTDYTAYDPGNSTATTDDTTAINFSTINMGTGSNDLVVLHSNDNSANVLEFTASFGKVSVVNFFDNTISEVAAGTNLTVGNHLLDFTAILDNKVDVSTGNSNTQSSVAIANTVNKTTTAEANSVSVLKFTADATNANAVNWDGLNATNLVDALNGKAGAAILGNNDIKGDSLNAATTTADGDLIGSTHKHVVMVENASNLGEYKVFALTSASTSANFDATGMLLGTLDFGYSIGSDFKLAGDLVNTAGELTNNLVASLERNADQLLNGTLTDVNGTPITFGDDILAGTGGGDTGTGGGDTGTGGGDTGTGGFTPVAPVGGAATATDGVADAITFADLTTGNSTITGFNVAEDKLVLTGLTDATGTTLADLAGDTIATGVIGVQVNEITGSTFVNLGLDADGAVISIELAGVTDPALVNVDLLA